mgnify:CR=1 FL=1
MLSCAIILCFPVSFEHKVTAALSAPELLAEAGPQMQTHPGCFLTSTVSPGLHAGAAS